MDPVELHNFLVDLRYVLSDSLPTLRDRFAMAAAQGLAASGDHVCPNALTVAATAYELADAMLKARELKPEAAISTITVEHPRYEAIYVDDAFARGLPGAEEFGKHCCGYLLYELDAGKPIRLVGSDIGEPEDKLLVRDLKWVMDELNRDGSVRDARDTSSRQSE